MRPDPLARMREQHKRAALAADAHLQAAKRQVSAAAVACQKGAPDADAKVQAALQEIERARAEIRKVDDDR